MTRFLRTAEAFFVLLFLFIGCWTAFSFFRGAYNTNDLMCGGNPVTEVPSNSIILLTGTIKNYSEISLGRLSVIADAYDGDGRLIGTGTFISDPGVSLPPSYFLQYSVKIVVPSGYRNVKNFMLIPRSSFGTGKLQTVLLN